MTAKRKATNPGPAKSKRSAGVSRKKTGTAKAKPKTNPQPDTIKVKFLISPAAKYRVAGEPGSIKEINRSQAEEMIENGDAEKV